MTRKHLIALISSLFVSLQTLALWAAPLRNLKTSGMAEIRGTHLYYEVHGHGAPLVFLHAGIADNRMWDSQVEYFSHADYTVVRLDTRGYGKSDAPTRSVLSRSRRVRSFLQFLKFDRACIIGLSRWAVPKPSTWLLLIRKQPRAWS